jgi:DNA-binding IclR family transcriptional regulator
MGVTPSPAAIRAAELLHELARQPAGRFTVSELARSLGIPRATCDTLLHGLSEGGLVSRDSGLRYQLGPGCIVIGDAARTANLALRSARVEAELLAKQTSSVTAVSIRDRFDTRVANVFDFGPAIGLRARVGATMPLVPPFGATFVAWDTDSVCERWLERTQPPLTSSERTHYRRALHEIRRRGFSVTLVTDRQPTLIAALERVAEHAGSEDASQDRDQVARQMTHGEYLLAAIEPDELVRVAQVSAPVFQADGTVGVSIMLLGPTREVTAAEVNELGTRVAGAAAAATRSVAGGAPMDDGRL